MPEPWGADVHSGLRVYFDADGRACVSAPSAPTRGVRGDVAAKIVLLRLRADQFEVWLRAWSEQEDG